MAGVGLALVAVGAVLRYGVTAEAQGIDLDVVGLILMVIGAIGFVIGLFQGRFVSRRTERHVSDDGHHVVEQSGSSSF